jgi:hypothetical protein
MHAVSLHSMCHQPTATVAQSYWSCPFALILALTRSPLQDLPNAMSPAEVTEKLGLPQLRSRKVRLLLDICWNGSPP